MKNVVETSVLKKLLLSNQLEASDFVPSATLGLKTTPGLCFKGSQGSNSQRYEFDGKFDRALIIENHCCANMYDI